MDDLPIRSRRKPATAPATIRYRPLQLSVSPTPSTASDNVVILSPRKRKITNTPASLKKQKTPKKRVKDPDDEDGGITDEDDVDDLTMDQPERFKTATRLRKKKETPFQRQIRKNRNKREGIVESSTDEDEAESDSDDSDEASQMPVPEDSFIVDDGEELEEGMMPAEFSVDSAQTPEFKFKVVFHYLLLLVMDRQAALHLQSKDANYFMPRVEDLRRRMQGYREARVRGQIWRAELVRAMQQYPIFSASLSQLGPLETSSDSTSGATPLSLRNWMQRVQHLHQDQHFPRTTSW